MGHRRCEVCGIKQGRLSGNKLLFSNFPLAPNRCREWIKAVGNEELVHLPIEKLHEQRYVCANHFRKKDFNKKGNRLKRHSIPTLNLISLPLTDGQLAEFPQHIYRQSESKDDGTMQDDITAMDVESHEVQLVQDDSPQSDTTDEQPIYGENIDHSLAQHCIPLLKNGLAKDLKEKLLKEYQIPENCKLLKAPTLNREIKAAVSEIIINRDQNIQLKQDQLGLGISALNKAITQLLQGDDKIQAVKNLFDSSRILTDLHYTETQVRTKLITPCLNKSFIPLIKDHERDETIFGEKFTETVRAFKAIERQELIKKFAQRATSLPAKPTPGPSTAGTRFSGNGTDPVTSPRAGGARRICTSSDSIHGGSKRLDLELPPARASTAPRLDASDTGLLPEAVPSTS